MNPVRARALVLLVTFVAAACNATAPPPLPTATPVVTAAATIAGPAIVTPVALRGTWSADVSGTSASSGVWKLIISESNMALQNPIGGDPFTLDPVSFNETAVVFPAASDCPDQATVTTGTYSIALRVDSLVFTLGADSCGDRSATLTTTPWTRAP